MKEYKYILDKSSKKFICPKCLKKTFVKYFDPENNSYLPDEFGRCDRETNCGFHSLPNGEYKNTSIIKDIAVSTPSFHDKSLLIQSKCNYAENNFIHFLKTKFSEAEIEMVIEKYHIGTSTNWKGSTVFWQIDNLGRIHAGKILQYNKETGKRSKDKSDKALISWIHSILKRNNNIKEFNLKQCLFGLQLVDTEIERIALVESEKTAVIMSLFKPQYTWLATGSKHGFKLEYLEPIKHLDIVAFPDKSEYEIWTKKAEDLNKIGYKISVNEKIEITNYATGTDIADIFILEKNDLTLNKSP